MYIKAFKDLKKGDTDIAGGKGASLGEMTQAGITVPPGYVVLTSAFDFFLQETDLTQEIAAILKTVNKDAIHTVDDASEKIQGLILAQEIPKEIEKKIQKQFVSLGAEFVAVRSSATAEDGLDHAWAGQLDSYLNVTQDNLLESVKECWASLFTPRAIFYRFEKELQGNDVSVAVVVQKMVNSEKSGIAFSVHPVTEDYDQLIIEAGLGLGEAIVSGSITPDSYVVSKAQKKAIDINVNEQTKALYRKDGGGNEWTDLGARGEQQVLTGEEILTLTDMIITIEDHYGLPQDIEWAYEGSEFFITQSRPITTLSNITPSAEGNSTSEDTALNILKKGEWEIDWDATLPLLAVSILCDMYFDAMKERMGHCFSGIFSSHEKGKSVGYIEINELDGFATELLSHIDTVEKANAWSDSFKEVTDRIVDELGQMTVEKFLADPEKYLKLFDEYGTWQVGTKAIYGVLPPSFDPEISTILEDVRKYSEKFYKKLQIFEDIIAHIQSENSEYTTEQLSTLLKEEFFTYLESKILPGKKELQQRHERSGLLLTREQQISIGANELQEVLDSWAPEIADGEINGVSAYGGKVQGVCRLITRFEGEIDINEGDILVATMTDPNYIPLMSKAAAFVTDGGGMLCHAAIVAREMKKPCIIGTKIATQVLKDGDLVEVDADEGVVKILEKKSDDKNLMRDYDVDDWEIGKTSASPLIFDYNAVSWVKGSVERYGEKAPLKKYIVLIENGGRKASITLHKEDYVRSAQYLWNNRSVLEGVFSDFDDDEKKFHSLVEKLEKDEIKIQDYFQDFLNAYHKVYSSGSMFDGFLFYSEKLFDDIKSTLTEEGKDIADSLIQMPGLSFAQEEHLSLLKIAQSKENNWKKVLNLHQKKYHWILNNYKNVDALDAAYFENQLAEIRNAKDNASEIRKLEDYDDQQKKFIAKVTGDQTLSQKQIDDLALIGKISYYMDRRKAANLLGNHWIGQYIQCHAKRFGVSYDDLALLTVSEFEKLIKNEDLSVIENISDRRDCFGIAYDNGYQLYEGDECREVKRFFEGFKKSSGVDRIQGVTAYKGTICGRVKVFDYADEKELNEGEILVTSMTRPDFVPLMKKASAIVTDEGGITCHAAIISREMKKPCIIGTKIATQVLKDGDLVEVDADNGLVKILNESDE